MAVCTNTQKFTEYKIPNDPASNIPPKTYKKSIIRHLLNAAKSCIPLLWKQQYPPTTAKLLKRVEDINRMEDLILTAQKKHERYTKTWSLSNMFILSDEGKALFGT